jgi:hypothetical protein
MSFIRNDSSEHEPKVMPPKRVAAFNAFSLGLYSLRWYYRANRELRDYGTARQDQALARIRPGLALLAVTLGCWLLLPPLVSLIRFGGRLRRCERLAGSQDHGTRAITAMLICAVAASVVPVSGAAATLAEVLAVLALQSTALAMAQARLNRAWRYSPRAPIGVPAAMPARSL